MGLHAPQLACLFFVIFCSGGFCCRVLCGLWVWAWVWVSSFLTVFLHFEGPKKQGHQLQRRENSGMGNEINERAISSSLTGAFTMHMQGILGLYVRAIRHTGGSRFRVAFGLDRPRAKHTKKVPSIPISRIWSHFQAPCPRAERRPQAVFFLTHWCWCHVHPRGRLAHRCCCTEKISKSKSGMS